LVRSATVRTVEEEEVCRQNEESYVWKCHNTQYSL
jgi:hypothetical protein